ncbi:MAG TPA: hypothetical protein VM434_00060 [Beijerinckiaceae bacterium]|nr:hypothetical protein [Beijerinckiaceae bacterium]
MTFHGLLIFGAVVLLCLAFAYAFSEVPAGGCPDGKVLVKGFLKYHCVAR